MERQRKKTEKEELLKKKKEERGKKKNISTRRLPQRATRSKKKVLSSSSSESEQWEPSDDDFEIVEEHPEITRELETSTAENISPVTPIVLMDCGAVNTPAEPVLVTQSTLERSPQLAHEPIEYVEGDDLLVNSTFDLDGLDIDPQEFTALQREEGPIALVQHSEYELEANTEKTPDCKEQGRNYEKEQQISTAAHNEDERKALPKASVQDSTEHLGIEAMKETRISEEDGERDGPHELPPAHDYEVEALEDRKEETVELIKEGSFIVAKHYNKNGDAVMFGWSAASRPPHVVFILADDMGWNDVGFHGSDQIPTPNIDALAFNGLILNQHYTPALCTPSRAALLTGKYPIHTGMQHLVILESEPWGLGLQEKLLPEMLSQAGYRSHAVGKWHLGFYRKEYTPTFRGFDSHYGYWQGFHDYYNHSVRATYEPYDGYDMRRDLEVDWSAMGEYSTDLFTREAVKIVEDHDARSPLLLYLAHLAPHTGNMRDPFQAPDDVVAKFSHIRDPERRTYAAMVSKLDESVGEVVAALRRKHMLENSVIVFMSDNGAPTHGIHSNRGSNFPFRGIKNSAWEGGNRVAAAVWSPLIKKPKRVANQMMHMVDWLPTFYSLAGFNASDLNVDGVDMWRSLSEDKPSPRKEVLYNIDDVGNPYAAIRRGDWKYVSGSATGNRNNGWYGESGSDSKIGYHPEDVLMSKAGVAISAYIIKQQIQHKIRTESEANSVLDEEEAPPRLLDTEEMLRLRRQAVVECGVSNATDNTDCNPQESPCLFNLRQDPCEKVNLASFNRMILLNLEERVRRFRSTMLKARNVQSDVTADPGLWNKTWSCWQDEMEEQNLFIFRDLPGTLAAFLYTTLAFIVIVVLLVFYPKLIPTASIEPKKSKIMSVFALYGGQVVQDDKKPSS
ncbi:hypothetical protein GE061_006033 [Apolygus lucorum]|uniref:Sulfatase N-terminal domain-containing protein n=1 Tax=Apolygus lucorum TaxID=248454 RepID=A0A8S9WWN1_APOLU|nr:hypothetical protein GE061_006033 [Apolygus lucorum]